MSLQVKIKKKLGNFNLDVNFEAEGHIMGLLGASGCGKSYTLKCIAGIETPDSGRIVLDDMVLFDSEQKINLAPQKRKVGYLFQNYALFNNMSVEKNILCGLHGEPDRKKRIQEVKEVLHLFGLNGLEKHMPHQLSGGQAQRVAMARIMISEPRLLMLDEPFSALDSHLRERLQTELKSHLQKYNGHVLMVTHSRDEAYHMCEHIAVMANGRLLLAKETKALFADPESIWAARLTGCKNISPARKCGEYEVEALDWGVRFTSVRPVEDNLQAVGIRAHYFREKTGQNANSVHLVDEMEGPFEWIFQFRFAGQKEDAEPLWWRVPKGDSLQTFPDVLSVAPEDILLFYQ